MGTGRFMRFMGFVKFVRLGRGWGRMTQNGLRLLFLPELSRTSASRRRGVRTTSAGVSRPSEPLGPKDSLKQLAVSQPSSAKRAMAGCSTKTSSEKDSEVDIR